MKWTIYKVVQFDLIFKCSENFTSILLCIFQQIVIQHEESALKNNIADSSRNVLFYDVFVYVEGTGAF